jgi:hypothetical protein
LQVIEAGANALVAGSAVFGAESYSEGEVTFSDCFWTSAKHHAQQALATKITCFPLESLFMLLFDSLSANYFFSPFNTLTLRSDVWNLVYLYALVLIATPGFLFAAIAGIKAGKKVPATV